MGVQRRGVLIVTLPGIGDVEEVKRRVAEIPGVTVTDYNYLTQKFTVNYEGEEKRLKETELAIKEVLRDASPQPG